MDISDASAIAQVGKSEAQVGKSRAQVGNNVADDPIIGNRYWKEKDHGFAGAASGARHSDTHTHTIEISDEPDVSAELQAIVTDTCKQTPTLHSVRNAIARRAFAPDSTFPLPTDRAIEVAFQRALFDISGNTFR